MSTLKSSAEDLTLNADGSGNDIKFQSNGVEKASIDQDGVITAGGATMTGNLNMGANEIILADNGVIEIGTGTDLKIYHDGSHSYIKEAGTGSLKLLSSQFEVLNNNGTTDMIRGVESGAVTLYHNNASKLATSALGVTVTGGVSLGGTGAANTLEDYEEGTWTATFSGGTLSPSNSTGYYTKIGQQVFFEYYTGGVTISSAAGSARLSGLPFTSSSASYAYGVFTFQHGTALDGGCTGGFVSANNDELNFIDTDSVNDASWVNGAKHLMVAGQYTV